MQSYSSSQESPAFLEPLVDAVPEPVPGRMSISKSIAFLFTSFMISYCLVHALHELGHVLANTLGGGITTQITLNPFFSSYTYYQTNPQPVISSWGGVLFASLVGVAAWALLGGVRSPVVFPLRLLSLLGPLTNGLYLLLDQASGLGGDASALVQHGMSPLLVEGVGAVLIVLGLLLGLELAPVIGIQPRDSLGRRLLVNAGGVLPYLAFSAAYVSEFHPEAQAGWLLMLAGGAAVVLIYSILGWLMPGSPPAPASQPAPDLRWWQIEVLLALGLAIVAAELWFFPL
jgi:hypothetical protein